MVVASCGTLPAATPGVPAVTPGVPAATPGVPAATTGARGVSMTDGVRREMGPRGMAGTIGLDR